MAIISSWVICAIITAAGGFPSDPDNPNYLARTDRELSVLKEARWFRFPYPGKAKSLMRGTVIFFEGDPHNFNHCPTPCRSVGNANYQLRRRTWNANWVTRLPY